jgi:hypothetical protein
MMAEAVEWRLQGIVVYNADERYGRQTFRRMTPKRITDALAGRGQRIKRVRPNEEKPATFSGW